MRGWREKQADEAMGLGCGDTPVLVTLCYGTKMSGTFDPQNVTPQTSQLSISSLKSPSTKTPLILSTLDGQSLNPPQVHYLFLRPPPQSHFKQAIIETMPAPATAVAPPPLNSFNLFFSVDVYYDGLKTKHAVPSSKEPTSSTSKWLSPSP